jgi:hypothetical protein
MKALHRSLLAAPALLALALPVARRGQSAEDFVVSSGRIAEWSIDDGISFRLVDAAGGSAWFRAANDSAWHAAIVLFELTGSGFREPVTVVAPEPRSLRLAGTFEQPYSARAIQWAVP